MTMMILLFVAALWAGAQNALAGGGSFITLPVLILSGLDPRAANIASQRPFGASFVPLPI